MLDFVHRVADGIVRRGNAVALHEFFSEAFAGFELGSGLGGAEDSPATFAEFVDHSELERDFGAYHGQVGPDLIGQSQKRADVFYVGGETRGFVGNSTVTGRAVELRDARGLASMI